MHTTIKAKIDSNVLLQIFDNYPEICNIRHYAYGSDKSEIEIRHNEGEDPKKLFKNAIKQHDRFNKLIEKLDNNNIHVDNYEENGKVCGFELISYTDGGVNIIIFLDFRDTELNPFLDVNFISAFKEWVADFDIDEQIDLHRQDERYRNDFTIRESLNDFTNYKKELSSIFK
jgi:hypothetical protein